MDVGLQGGYARLIWLWSRKNFVTHRRGGSEHAGRICRAEIALDGKTLI